MDSWIQGKAIQLTPREREIVELLLLGCDNAEISKNLNIAPRTVKAISADSICGLGSSAGSSESSLQPCYIGGIYAHRAQSQIS